jgi:hypothetical protein
MLLGNVEPLPGQGDETVFQAFAFDGESPDPDPGRHQLRHDVLRKDFPGPGLRGPVNPC